MADLHPLPEPEFRNQVPDWAIRVRDPRRAWFGPQLARAVSRADSASIELKVLKISKDETIGRLAGLLVRKSPSISDPSPATASYSR